VKKLGELLIDSDVIDREQLDKALLRQSSSGGKLGTNLVEMMLIDDVTLGNTLSKQLGVPAVHPKVLENVISVVLDTLTVNLVEYFHAFPFKLDRQRLHVAMLDPTNVALVDELSHRSGYIIIPYTCAESVLYRALSIHYSIIPPMRRTSDQEEIAEDVIVHDTSGIISLDDDGQFTRVDRTDILGEHTKNLFLEAETRTAIVGYFLQFLGYNTDRVAFLAYDKGKNFLWRDAKEFQAGRTGIACGVTVTRSKFWQRYLSRPGFFYSRLPKAGNEMGWVQPLLDMENVKGLFLAPLNISKKVLGVAIGGSSAALRLEEEIETIKKLHLIAVSALKIQEFKKIITNIS